MSGKLAISEKEWLWEQHISGKPAISAKEEPWEHHSSGAPVGHMKPPYSSRSCASAHSAHSRSDSLEKRPRCIRSSKPRDGGGSFCI